MKIIQFIAAIIGFIFYKPPVRQAPPAALLEEASGKPAEDAGREEKIFVHPHIRKLKDDFAFIARQQVRTFKDTPYSTLTERLDMIAPFACFGRAQHFAFTGEKLDQYKMTAHVVTSGRLDRFEIIYDFTDTDDVKFVAKPNPKSKERLFDLDRRLKRFLN